MKIHDVSLALDQNLPIWPGDPPLRVTRFLSLDEGADANASHLSCSVHCGTHVDAALHVIPGGQDVANLSLDALVGPAWVQECPTDGAVSAADLERLDLPERISRLLLKTANSARWATAEGSFEEDFVALAPDGARWIVQRGIALVGVDYLSVQSYHEESQRTHKALLSAGIVVLEGLDLSNVSEGEYLLVCLPLKIPEGDGAPARTILIEQ